MNHCSIEWQGRQGYELHLIYYPPAAAKPFSERTAAEDGQEGRWTDAAGKAGAYRRYDHDGRPALFLEHIKERVAVLVWTPPPASPSGAAPEATYRALRKSLKPLLSSAGYQLDQ